MGSHTDSHQFAPYFNDLSVPRSGSLKMVIVNDLCLTCGMLLLIFIYLLWFWFMDNYQ